MYADLPITHLLIGMLITKVESMRVDSKLGGFAWIGRLLIEMVARCSLFLLSRALGGFFLIF